MGPDHLYAFGTTGSLNGHCLADARILEKLDEKPLILIEILARMCSLARKNPLYQLKSINIAVQEKLGNGFLQK